MTEALWAEFNPRKLLGCLTIARVDFVVVGGYAAVLHGSPRITQDLDISYSTEPENLRALGGVLLELHARLFGVTDDVPFVPDERTLDRVEILTLDTDAGKLDLLTSSAGAPPYRELSARARAYDVAGFVVRIAAIPDLIAMKRAAGRPKDLVDVLELETIERLAGEASA
jgi:Nucleotidyl transferase AbiEii toxin, Type IV TA system